MIGFAPRADAATMAEIPTPPTPKTATLCPRCTSAVLSTAPAPVITAQPMIDARSTGMSGGKRHDELFVADRVIRPREHVVTRRRRAIGACEHRRVGPAAQRTTIARQPRDEDAITDVRRRHARPHRDDLAGRFVTERHR